MTIKKTKTPVNSPCGANRILTKREKETIASYNLHFEVEGRVVSDWKSRAYPRTIEKMKKKRTWMLISSNIVTYSLPFFLWLSYVDPKHIIILSLFGEEGVYVGNTIIHIGIILSWTLIVLGPIHIIAYIGIVKMVRYDPWHPTYLAIWKGMPLYRILFIWLWRLSIVIGVFLNGFVVLSVCVISAYLMMCFGRRLVRNAVKTAMYPY